MVPVSGNTAILNNPGNGNTTISLGGTVAIGGIKFDSAYAAAYTLGTAVGNGDAFKFDAGGAITVTGTVTTLQTFNAAIQALGVPDD